MRPPTSQLSILPLGGLGQVGMNSMVLEQDGEIVVLDCGVTFGGGELGVEVYSPRFDYLTERAAHVRCVLLTHGHEDHIGALPELLRVLKVAGADAIPVWGPPYALELARRRLAEQAPELGEVELRPLRPDEAFAAGPFTVEPLRVTHSIADAAALAIDTAAGLVVHTGDIKLDAQPPDGLPTDELRLEALGDRGVRLLLSDSTNVHAPGTSGAERGAAAALEQLLTGLDGRVVVGLFASNVHRLRAVGEIAGRLGRRLCLLGRSARTHGDAAGKLGLLVWPPGLLVAPDMARSLARRSVLYAATGTQAEGRAALRRLASGLHPDVRLEPGDSVVLSSRIIPGNERAVVAMIDDFVRIGVRVHTPSTAPGIHASGHAHRDELRHVLELVRPRAFVPVHGTMHMLDSHARLARELGVSDTLVIENGERITIGADEPLRRDGVFPAGRLARSGGRVIAADALRERLELSRSGAVVCHMIVSDEGRLVTVRIAAPGSGLGAADCADIERALVHGFVWPGKAATEAELADLVRQQVRRQIKGRQERMPLVEVMVSRLPRQGSLRSRAHAIVRLAVQEHLALARSGAERLCRGLHAAAVGDGGAPRARDDGQASSGSARAREAIDGGASIDKGSVPDPEAVHDLRVGLRRARTVLRVARPVYGVEELERLGRALRGLAQATGELRDAEVLLETLKRVADHPPADVERTAEVDAAGVPRIVTYDLHAAVEPWLGRIRRRETKLRRRMVRSVSKPRFERILRDVERAIERGPVDRGGPPRFLERTIEAALAEVRSFIDVDGDDITGLHELRIRFKRLRYAAEMFAGGADGAQRPVQRRMATVAGLAKRMQDRLGALHDVDDALQRAAGAGALDDASRDRLIAALRARRLELLAPALEERQRVARALRLHA